MGRSSALVLGALCLSVAVAQTNAPSLFGVSLGQTVTGLPGCPPNGRCVVVPRDRPEYLSGMHVEVRDGKVVQVVANTRGLAFQNEILEALSGKFGDPASVARDFVRDSSGSAFQSLRVQWRLPTGSLRMLGAESSPDKGAIYLSDR